MSEKVKRRISSRRDGKMKVSVSKDKTRLEMRKHGTEKGSFLVDEIPRCIGKD